MIPNKLENTLLQYVKLIKPILQNCDSLGRNDIIANSIHPILNFFYEQYFRVTCVGHNTLKKKSSFIIIANHSGTIPYDAAMMAVILKKYVNRNLRFLADPFAYKLPYLGSALKMLGALEANWENAEKILNAGHPLLIFPEGVGGIGKLYSQRYKLSKFRRGFAKLSKKLDVPIIPCGIVGAEEIHPVVHREESIAKSIGLPFIPFTPTFPWLGPLGFIPLPTKWVISFGKTVKPTDTIPKIVSNSRSQVVELIAKGRKKRKSIWE